MKKVLLTTTALVMTAGVASAEITFSGVGEAGFYRTGKVKAAAAVAGTQNSVSINGSDVWTKATTVTTASTSTTIADEYEDMMNAKADLAIAQYNLDNGFQKAATRSTTERTTLAHTISAESDVAEKQAALEAAEATYALHKGTAAKAAVKAGDMKAYSGYDFNVAASGASDNGMTFAMGFDMGAGHIADQDDDRAMDAQAGTIDTSALTIGYNGYTIAIGDEKVDDLYDADGWNADVSLSGSFGDLTFSVATDLDKDVAAADPSMTAATSSKGKVWNPAVAAEWNPTSYAIGYTMGDMSFSMAGTDHDAFGNAAAKYELTYKVLPALSATLSSDNVGTYKDIGKLSATYTVSDAMSITASVKDDKDHALNTNTGGKQSQDMSIAYSAGAMSATIASDESSNWWVNAKYDLGGGATAFTTFDHTEFLVAGVNFKF